MLRHTGQNRSFKHNLRLAVLLCLNAGFINAAGYFAFKVLTTNVTGHAAIMAVSIATSDLHMAATAAAWLSLFLLGAFCSAFVINAVGRDKANAYTIPIVVILSVVLVVALWAGNHIASWAHERYFAGALLFAMGMQNAMVSVISGSVVRTTHLTGMFTDLGIDLASVFSSADPNKAVNNRIVLRLTIISFFLLGGVAGGIAFLHFSFHAFLVPAVLLVIALFYDYFRVRLMRMLRKKQR